MLKRLNCGRCIECQSEPNTVGENAEGASWWVFILVFRFGGFLKWGGYTPWELFKLHRNYTSFKKSVPLKSSRSYQKSGTRINRCAVSLSGSCLGVSSRLSHSQQIGFIFRISCFLQPVNLLTKLQLLTCQSTCWLKISLANHIWPLSAISYLRRFRGRCISSPDIFHVAVKSAGHSGAGRLQ